MMKCITKFSILFPAIVIFACNNKQPATAQEQKTALVFPKGEVITNNNFTGTAWL
jgi:hypothetical protein